MLDPARQSPLLYDIEEYKGHCSGEPGELSQAPGAPKMQPPRLSGPGSCMRMLMALLCLSCFGVLCLLVTLVANHIPTLHGAKPVVPPRPLPALLKRFAKLKKATSGTRGAMRESVHELFPHWGMAETDEVRTGRFCYAFIVQLSNRQRCS